MLNIDHFVIGLVPSVLFNVVCFAVYHILSSFTSNRMCPFTLSEIADTNDSIPISERCDTTHAQHVDLDLE